MPDGARILLVEDDPDQVQALTVILEPEGYRVIVATTGQEGLEKAAEERPDLIVLDIMMTDETEGIRVAHKLRSPTAGADLAPLREVPIIALSAIHQETRLRFDTVAGTDMLPVDEWMDKPVDPQQLLDKIKELLARRQ